MSFSDMFKKNSDLGGAKAFTTDTSFKIKSKTAEGVSLEANANPKGMHLKGKWKNDTVNLTKVTASTDGHFDLEGELANAIDNATITFGYTVGSEAWKAAKSKNNESAKFGFRFSGVKDLDCGAEVDLVSSPASLTLDACYKYEGFSVGGEFGLNLPFDNTVDNAAAPEAGLDSATVGLKYASGDFEVGATFDDALGAKLTTINFHHQASADTQWGVIAEQSKGDEWLNRAWGMKATVQYQVDNQTTATVGLNKDMVFDCKYAQTVSSGLKMTYQAQINADGVKLAGDGKFGIGFEVSA
jgi:hypothetical protein